MLAVGTSSVTVGSTGYTLLRCLGSGWTLLSRARPKTKQGQMYVHVRHDTWPASQPGKRVEFGSGLYKVMQVEAQDPTSPLCTSFTTHMREYEASFGRTMTLSSRGREHDAAHCSAAWLADQKDRLQKAGNKRLRSSTPRSEAQKEQQLQALAVAARNGADWAGALKEHLGKVRCSRPEPHHQTLALTSHVSHLTGLQWLQSQL